MVSSKAFFPFEKQCPWKSFAFEVRHSLSSQGAISNPRVSEGCGAIRRDDIVAEPKTVVVGSGEAGGEA